MPAAKSAILADLAFGDKINPDAVSCEGITNITLEDVAAADRMGYAIKLLGRAKRTENGKVYAFVAPHLLAKTMPLASVEGVFNGISVTGNMVGEVYVLMNAAQASMQPHLLWLPI